VAGKRRGCLTLLGLFVVAIGALWLLRFHVYSFLGNALVENDGPQKAQAIVVMGGDETGARIIKAAELAQSGYAPVVMVSGPPMLMGWESDLTIRYAESKGFPASLFQPLDNQVHSTRSETIDIAKDLKRDGIHKILLVTSNYHSGRAGRLMRAAAPWCWVVVIAAPDPAFDPNGWWKDRESQKQFLFEWMKTVSTALGN
jgi:uncharacterized SAM-binding protein YcdF (DUF218 family)